MEDEIQLTQTEIDGLKTLENELAEIKSKIRSYKIGLIRSHGCKDVMGIFSYKKVRYNYLGQINSEKDYTFLAWRHQWFIGGNRIIPRYSYVTSDGRIGNVIELVGKDNVEFVPLDDCTYEEAKCILKDVKRRKISDSNFGK